MLEVLRSGRLSLGPAIDRFEELFAETVGAPYAAAVSSGTSGLHLLCGARRVRDGRRGDHVAVLLRRLGQLLHLRGRDAGLRGRRRADDEPRSWGGRGGDHRPDEGRRRRRHLRLSVRARPASRALRRARPDADPGRRARRSAPSTRAAGRIAGQSMRSSPSTRTSRSRPARAGSSTTHSEETQRQLVSLRNQGRADGGGWLDHARLGFNYRIDDVRAALGIGQLEKLDTILSLRQSAAARYGELLAGVDGLELPLADDADHVRSWFVYVVTLAARHRPRARDRGARPPGDCDARATCRRSTCRRTCASATASRKACALSPRTSRSVRSRFRSSPRSMRTTRNASPRH